MYTLRYELLIAKTWKNVERPRSSNQISENLEEEIHCGPSLTLFIRRINNIFDSLCVCHETPVVEKHHETGPMR